ncbi:MAG: hypothetical protein R3B82_12350 [Sandaracinaceae bacterium]
MNTGARSLLGGVKAGEIIISEHTLAMVRDYFEVIALPLTQVKEVWPRRSRSSTSRW